ncbi:S-layer homology domain-containing protein [Pseudanabaena sp. FACHB-2040]|uniref:S-layer homology domain-containing protein n=1 Tax=Pseudanabaena sp. FACHB-2040 TaxID=2692859 RepID=UPI001683FD43|nr:S-layer homology domain-containing protein [Pseudanabaena sp. FACHB-2040]MBD2256695.1 S-layer homology domain-containing protein [Pseudanabaena sp. FACHB-2040]
MYRIALVSIAAAVAMLGGAVQPGFSIRNLAVNPSQSSVFAEPSMAEDSLAQAERLPEGVQARILEQVAEEQDRSQDSLEVVSATAMEWSDGCLGLGGPAESCLMAITPGWRVTITDGSASWVYRTDASGQGVRQETPSEVPQYTDIDGRYAPEIANVTSQGILVESPEENRFYPNRPITREELAVAIVQAMQLVPLSPADAAMEATAQLPPLPNELGTAPFRDVAANRRSARAIQYLKGLGLIQGYSDGSFRPEQPVTRAELMSLLLKMDVYLVELRRWDGRDASNLEPTFAFSDTRGHWAAKEIAVMSENCRAAEPMNGEGTRFAPNAPATRGYAAAAIARDLWCLSY